MRSPGKSSAQSKNNTNIRFKSNIKIESVTDEGIKNKPHFLFYKFIQQMYYMPRIYQILI